MTSFRIRPRFEVQSNKKMREIIEGAKDQIAHHGQLCPCEMVHSASHLILKIKAEDQHYWSPQLQLSLREEGDHTIIHGLYGPNPNVWTLFTLAYLAIGILSLFVAIIGFSRWSLGLSAPILWLLPVLGGLAFLLYLSSQLGQKIGAEQTFTLHHFLEDLLDQVIPIH